MDTKLFEARVANVDCENDARRVERGLREAAGVAEVTVYPRSARVTLRYDPATTTPERLGDTLRGLGFPPHEGASKPALPRPWENPKVLASVASGILLLAGWLIVRAGASEAAQTTLYLLSLLTGGYYFGREAIEELVFERKIGIELLMTIAAVVATLMGAPGEGAMLAFLYSISEAAEGYTEQKTRSAIAALMDLTPKFALVRRDGREVEVPVEELVPGDVFIVKPGQSIATDGEVLVGTSSVNQAPVTGESVPVEKAHGDLVFAGSINGQGALDVGATKAFNENTIARIIHMVEEAQERKGSSERFIQRFGRRYSPAVLAVGILIALVPSLLFAGSWSTWIMRATVFIVAAAPCALVISIPITLVATLGTGARRGVLIKGGVFVEELAKVSVVALDKTGTITHGEPEVTDVVPLDHTPERRQMSGACVLALAAAAESRSEHPLARAIVRYAGAHGIQAAEVSEFRSFAGAGVAARVDGTATYVGSPDLFESDLRVSLTPVAGEITRLQMEGKTVVVVGDDHAPWGLLGLRDTVRPNVVRAVRKLHDVGVKKVVMLTGDNPRAATAIADEVGIDVVHANLKPDEKALKVRELGRSHGHVAMVGDGVNDAPALAEATVGVAMGAAGTDVALETADVALMADDLEKLVYALQLAKRNERVVRQNLALSVLVISVLVAGAVAGVFTLPVAVLGHELSEFAVIGSGLRMLRA